MMALAYYRLHSARRRTYADYDQAALDRIAERLGRFPSVSKWCIFDRPAAGARKRCVDRGAVLSNGETKEVQPEQECYERSAFGMKVRANRNDSDGRLVA
jgi:uncharacterized protein YecE (DUF72 family)